MAISIDATARTAMVDAVVDLVDAGGTGTLEIRTGTAADPDSAPTGTLLATLTFSATAFGAASDDGTTATATANAITDDTSADATDTAGHFVVKSGGGNVVMTGTVTATGGGGDLELNTVSIVTGNTVSVTSFTVTGPQAQA